jgi:hypothetical protein
MHSSAGPERRRVRCEQPTLIEQSALAAPFLNIARPATGVGYRRFGDCACSCRRGDSGRSAVVDKDNIIGLRLSCWSGNNEGVLSCRWLHRTNLWRQRTNPRTRSNLSKQYRPEGDVGEAKETAHFSHHRRVKRPSLICSANSGPGPGKPPSGQGLLLR